MQHSQSLEKSYLTLFKFLMLSKRRVFDLGTELGLTGMQTMMLFLLDVPRPMNKFRKLFNCDPSNITGLVDGLEQKQLARRYESPTDRRIKMVKLEPKGTQVRRLLMQSFMTHNSPLLSQLTTEELTTFIHLLEKITTRAEHA